MSNIRTSLPVATQPWEAAKARFLERLSPEDVRNFHEATIENLFYATSAAQKRYAQQSRSWPLQQRLSSLVDAIDDYGKALDVFANTYSLVLSPVWGSIRVVIHVRTRIFYIRVRHFITRLLAQHRKECLTVRLWTLHLLLISWLICH
jgi:hypothetical protein